MNLNKSVLFCTQTGSLVCRKKLFRNVEYWQFVPKKLKLFLHKKKTIYGFLFRISGKVVEQVNDFARNQHIASFQHPGFGDRLIYLYNVTMYVLVLKCI